MEQIVNTLNGLIWSPPLIVLDTRTRRWRSERRLEHPSGLMDWEALCDFQQALLDLLDAHDAKATFFLVARRAAQKPELVR